MMDFSYLDDIFAYKESSTDQTDECDEDFYKILGCHPGSSNEQIMTEYRIRAKALHPDKLCKTSLNENDAEKLKNECERKFCRLQHAKDILLDETKRKDYDRWRQSGLKLSYQRWCQMNANGVHNSIHWCSLNRDPKFPLLKDVSSKSSSSSECKKTQKTLPNNVVPLRDFVNTEKQFKLSFRQNESETCSLLKQFRNYEI